MRLPVPLVEEGARSTEPRTETLPGWSRTCRPGRSVATPVVLDAALAVPMAAVEGTARTTEAIERAFPPGDVPDAAENHQTPGEVGTVVVAPHLGRRPALDQAVPETVVIGIVDQPEPAEHEQTDQ